MQLAADPFFFPPGDLDDLALQQHPLGRFSNRGVQRSMFH